MADFYYASTGLDENGKAGVHLFGYGVVDKSTVYTLPYKEGDIVFLKFRAEVGIMESIRIKRVLMNVDVYGLSSPIYVDMLNAYYTQRDFLDHAGAVVVANAYIDKQQQYITDALEIDQANERTDIPTPTAIAQNGLVLHLDAGDSDSYNGSGTTWSDLTDNGNDATLVNGPVFNSTDGGGSFLFDGSNDVVRLPSDSSIENGDTFTLECWTQIESHVGVNHILWFKYNVLLWYSPTNKQNYGGYFGGSWYQSATGNGIYSSPPTDWMHWVYTYDSSTGVAQLYLNGSLEVTSTWSGTSTMLNTTSDTYLMAGNASGNQPINGRLAVVRMYDVTLTAAQVEENYDTQKTRF